MKTMPIGPIARPQYDEAMLDFIWEAQTAMGTPPPTVIASDGTFMQVDGLWHLWHPRKPDEQVQP